MTVPIFPCPHLFMLSNCFIWVNIIGGKWYLILTLTSICFKGDREYFPVFTDHLDLFSHSIENSFIKQRNIFHNDPSAVMIYLFQSLGHHEPAWIRHFQGVTIHRSSLFWKSHNLIRLASHFSTLLPRGWFSFPLYPYFPQFPRSGVSLHHFNKCTPCKVTKGLLIAKLTTLCSVIILLNLWEYLAAPLFSNLSGLRFFRRC